MSNCLKHYLSGFLSLTQDRPAHELFKKGKSLWRREGAKGFKRALQDILNGGISYRQWILKYDSLSYEDCYLINQHITQLDYKPLISVLMPVYNTPENWLIQAIETVRNQLYPYWELCIADDASTLPHVRRILEEFQGRDSRIKVVFRTNNGHISAATNSALEVASGEFMALLDHDDELAVHALYHVAVALNDRPELDLLYSDEDKVDDKGRRFGHYFKPDWNPDLFLAQNLISHLGVYRTQIAREIEGFREGLEGSQDWDFALRFIGRTSHENILHLPYVLYHWRSIPGSTAISVDEKGYAKHAAKRALQEFWQRRNLTPCIEHVSSGHFRTKFDLPDDVPLVSCVIVSSEGRSDELLQCLNNILWATHYSQMEILLVVTESSQSIEAQIEPLKNKLRLRVLPDPGLFSLSAIYNCAVGQASGSVICLLDVGVKPLTRDWLEEMVGQALRSEIGVVGGITYCPDNTIHDAGYRITDEGTVKPLYSGYSKGMAGYVNRARLVQNLSIVSTTCVMVTKAVWAELGGLDPHYSDSLSIIDFCLRVEGQGYRNVWTPHAEFQFHPARTPDLKRGLHKREKSFALTEDYMKKWGGRTQDPAWNPNLILNGRYTQLASPPKISKPWLYRVT